MKATKFIRHFWKECSLLLILSITTIYFGYSNDFRLSKFRGTKPDVEMKSYPAVVLQVDKDKLSGKLNQYVSAKHLNDHCYTLYCGFPDKGEYALTKADYLKLFDRPFFYRGCIGEQCFYNLTNEQFQAIKQQIEQEETAKRRKLVLIVLGLAILAGLIDIALKYRKMKTNSSLK